MQRGVLRRRGFTLIELLVVIGIIAVLIGLLVPAVQKVRDAANRIKCANNLKQMGIALHSYHDTHGCFPCVDNNPNPVLDWSHVNDGNPGGWQKYWALSWQSRILPFLEQDNLVRQTEAAENGKADDTDTNSWVPYRYYPFDNQRYHGLATSLPVFSCPADGRSDAQASVGSITPNIDVRFTSYLGVLGISHFGGKGNLDPADANTERDPTTGLLTGMNGVLVTRQNCSGRCPPGVRFADITDGTSNTLLVGERPPSFALLTGWWFAGWGNTGDGDLDVLLGISERNANGPMSGNNPSGYLDPDGNPCSPGSPDPASPLAYKFGPGSLFNECDQFHYWSLHSGGGNFVFADGSVHFLTYNIEPAVQRALATRHGGEVATLP